VVIKTTELHTYVGRSVVLHMETQDVIHSFWVPAFRIKQDLIPGRPTTVRFTPLEVPGAEYPARYPIKCAELCGANHGMMIASVVVHKDESDFKAWYDGEVDKLLHPPADPVERGRGLLSSNVYPCYTCHVESDLGWVGNVGPSLNGLGDRAANRATVAGVATARDYIYQSLHEPGAYLVPGFGNLMPNLQIPECEALAIVAYLCTQTNSGEPGCTVDDYAAKCAAPAAEATPVAEATVEATVEAAPAAEATVEATVEAAPAVEATAEATASS
jgi:cytochrome c oxidase subunit 2